MTESFPISNIRSVMVKRMKQAVPEQHRGGIGIVALGDQFPDEASVTDWVESLVWTKCRHCPSRGCTETRIASNTAGFLVNCTGCWQIFSVELGAALESPKDFPLNRAFAVYLEITNLRGVSSMKLHRYIKVKQKTAWLIMQRVREAWTQESKELFEGPAEVDEACVCGKAGKLPGCGAVGETAVLGTKNHRIRQFAARTVQPAKAHAGIDRDHGSISPSVREYVREFGRTNSVKSFRSMRNRDWRNVHHLIRPKHLDRRVSEFAECHSIRETDVMIRMEAIVGRMVGDGPKFQDSVP